MAAAKSTESQLKGMSTKDTKAEPLAPESDAEVPEGLTEEDIKAAREAYLRAWPLEASERR